MIRYALRNAFGDWYRGGWKCWTPDDSKAKLYATIGQARGRRTGLNNHFGMLELVKLECEPVPIDDSEFLEKALRRKSLKHERAEAARAKRGLEDAQRAFNEAKRKLDEAVLRC